MSLTTQDEYDWNCQGPVARWLPRGGVRLGEPHEISNFMMLNSTTGASLSQLNSPTRSPREVTGWGRGGTDVASPTIARIMGVHSLHNLPIHTVIITGYGEMF